MPEDDRGRRSDEPADAAPLRAPADGAEDIIYGIDRYGRVSFHNEAATRVLGYSTECLVGRHYLELVAERDRDRVHRFYLRQMARKIPNTTLEFLARAADGAELRLEQSVQLVVESDELLGFYAVARSIGERRRRSSAESLLGSSGGATDVARLDTGDVEPTGSSLDLRALVDNVVAAFATQARERRLHLSTVFYRETPAFVNVDGRRLRQVLETLVDNALRFTVEGDIVVRVRRRRGSEGPGEIRFEVSDTGPGLEAGDVARFVGPFAGADESAGRVAAPGLATSRRLVELMGGTIGIEGREAGGATFWFTVPVAPGALPRLLVVDDNPVNRIVTLGQLRQGGVEADVATDGWEALDALARRRYDVILMDCDMPALDGCAATELIRRFEAPDDHIVIVALTARSGDDAREACRAAGMDLFLGKPVRAAQLVGLLARVEELRSIGLRRKAGVVEEPPTSYDAGVRGDALGAMLSAGDARIADLDAALERRDVEGVRSVARGLAESARAHGARRLAGLLSELAQWLPDRRIEGARFLARQVRRALEAAALPEGRRHPGAVL